MPVPKVFHFTTHSKSRGKERHISREEFISTVSAPDIKKQICAGNKGGFRYIFLKNIDSRLLTVVAEVKREECWFITGYWQD